MRIVWTKFAVADRDRIFDHLARESPLAAVQIDERIAAAIARLADFPRSGRPGRVAETRELVISSTPYVAAYAVLPDRIRVLRILHGAQEWPDAFEASGG